MARRVINLSEEGYEKVKEFCEKNDLKISKWCERILLEEIQREKKDGKKKGC
jgi:hypothetical protein